MKTPDEEAARAADDAARYEIRDKAEKASKKKFHVWDRWDEWEVFHTDSRDRAERLIREAGNGPVDQHLKDGYGHLFVHINLSNPWLGCATCKSVSK